MKKIKVGLIGVGNIGLGVCESFIENGSLLQARKGIDISLVKVCDTDKSKLDMVPDSSGIQKVSDASSIINDPDIDIVIELIGGIDTAKKFVIEALNNGKHIVTANKALISECGNEIFEVSRKNNAAVKFEASVGGGIPVIKTLKDSFVSNRIELICGIVNGTTNFVLSMMDDESCSFEDALKLAQEKGIAESDPTLDISGKDSAHKLAVLSRVGFGKTVSPDEIYTEGIERIRSLDILYAGSWGYSIKLLAVAKVHGKELELRVTPCLVHDFNLLSSVKGEDNAIFIKGDFVGESLLYGKGAGKRPTASSVLSDVVEIADIMVNYSEQMFCDPERSSEELSLINKDDLFIPFYLRFSVIDKPGVLASISSVLSENDISIASMSQEDRNKGETVPVIMLTHLAREGSMANAIKVIDEMDFVTDRTVAIRIEV